jgi:hypothetical protein
MIYFWVAAYPITIMAFGWMDFWLAVFLSSLILGRESHMVT